MKEPLLASSYYLFAICLSQTYIIYINYFQSIEKVLNRIQSLSSLVEKPPSWFSLY